MTTTPAYCSIKTLCRMLDFGETKVREMVKRGDLPAPKMIGGSPRWKWAEVESYIDGGGKAPKVERDPILEAAHGT